MLTEGPPPTLLPPRHTSSTYEAPRMNADFIRLGVRSTRSAPATPRAGRRLTRPIEPMIAQDAPVRNRPVRPLVPAVHLVPAWD